MVSQVDFYLSAGERPQSQPLLACRLAAKAFDHNLKSYILASDKRQVRILDQLLWTYDDCSFIPHEALLTVDAPSTPCPVLIGSIDAEKTGFDVLISLCPDIPQHYQNYHRIADIIATDETSVALARKRFRYYREQGYSPNFHELKS